MSLPAEPLRFGINRRYALAAAVAGVAVWLVLPWWRNHTYLRDFYDYGLVVAGAFRLSLGERPYVDFLTPIQTLHFRLAELAESVFGARYLSLTYANALFIVAAFGGLAALLVRPLGGVVAVIVAAAVVAASAGQHTIVWHNAMGVVWVAAVVFLTAPRRRSGEPGAGRRLGLVWLFLWLLGMTKLTYLATGLAFAGLFALRDGWLGVHSWRRVGLMLAGYAFFGLVAPVETELYYTGATWEQWLHNVVLLPESRVELLRPMATLKFYLQTPHDYYQPMYFRFVGAWGTGVLLLLGAVASWQTRGVALRGRSAVFLAVLLAGSWICGGVLLATNFDIGYLAGAAWLVFGAGVVLAMPAGDDGRVATSARVALGLAGASLLAPAWQASWAGTRALWGNSPLVRSELVPTDGLPARFKYFYGLRIPEQLHVSMNSLAGWLKPLAAEGIPASSWYFANATEWLVRAVPEARHRGLPLWLQNGTTFGDVEAGTINHLLGEGDEIRAVISLEAWNVWFRQMDWYLMARFKHEHFGPIFNVYLRRNGTRLNWQDPFKFVSETGSTAYVKDLAVTGGPPVLCLRPEGNFVGSRNSMTIGVKAPLARIQGEWVVRRIGAGNSRLSTVDWRAVAVGAQGAREILGNGRIELDSAKQETTSAFDLAPAGRVVTLELELPPGGNLEAGFRALETEYAGVTPEALGPSPLDPSLTRQPSAGAWAAALFATGSLRTAPLEGAAVGIAADQVESVPCLLVHAPGQVWFRIDPRFTQLRGEFGLKDVAWTNPGALSGVSAKIAFYRPGRLEILYEKEIRPLKVEPDRAPQPFEVELPGEEGWVGLDFTSLDLTSNAFGHSWWRRIEAR